MGEGHNATARALEERARVLWPNSRLLRLDTLAVMGPGVGPVFRRIYVANVQTTPWLYEYFYASLQRHRWFATASKRFVGSWCGRRLAPLLADYRPDLVISTYPLGSAGLDWLRRHRGWQVPTGAWISDFAPHPFWVYAGLDAHLVMHEVAVAPAKAAEPTARVAVCAPPVVAEFRVRDRREQRRLLGLDPEVFLAVLSCGAFGFGSVDVAVPALLAVDERLQVVVVCGRNAALRRRLLALGYSPQRLLPLGWVPDMPAWNGAADVVITNAGGATALEALAAQRAIVMFDPIAAHGRANAELMAEAGLALLVRTASELTATISQLARDRHLIAGLESAAAAHVRAHDLDGGLRELARGPARPGPARLRAADAFFLHVESATVAQQVGAVLVLRPSPALAEVRAAVAARLPDLPTLRRRLVGGGAWRPARWSVEDDLDLHRHVDERVLNTDDAVDTAVAHAAIDEFFSEPLARDRPLWQMRLVRGRGGASAVLAVKVHHSLGDGLSVIGTLSGLLDSQPSADGSPGPPTRLRAGSGSDDALRRHRRYWCGGTRVLRGLMGLLLLGRAPRSPLNTPLPSPRRHVVTTSLPTGRLRLVARWYGVRVSDVAVWLAAAGVSRLLADRVGAQPVPTLRAMIPVSQAAARRTWGNWTGALPVDLPTGPMPEAERLARISAAVQRQSRRGTSYAAAAVVRTIGAFPPWLHARLARLVYRDRWFNLILSFMPGSPSDRFLADARLAETYPVLPVARGVGLSIGLMSWAGQVGIGITVDPGVVPDADRLPAAMRQALEDLVGADR